MSSTDSDLEWDRDYPPPQVVPCMLTLRDRRCAWGVHSMCSWLWKHDWDRRTAQLGREQFVDTLMAQQQEIAEFLNQPPPGPLAPLQVSGEALASIPARKRAWALERAYATIPTLTVGDLLTVAEWLLEGGPMSEQQNPEPELDGEEAPDQPVRPAEETDEKRWPGGVETK